MISITMTQEEFAAKSAELKAKKGIDLVGRGGTISNSGVTATYSFDGSTLQVAVTKAPFLISKSKCESLLREWLTT
jgi:hypothetical protein